MADTGKVIGNIKLGISLEGIDESIKNLDQLNKRIKVNESSMRANLKAFDSSKNSVEALSQKQKDLTSITSDYDAKIKLLKKRLEEQEKAENRNEAAIANTQKAINDATAKYNGYNAQLQKTKEQLAYAESGVESLSDALKQNEKQTQAQVKALKDAGDQAGAFEAKQKGLEKQQELLNGAIKAQKEVVSRLSNEFGASSTQVDKAKQSLQSLENQASITDRQLDALRKSTKDTADTFENSGDSVGIFQGSLMADFATEGLEKVKDMVGNIIDNINEASEQYRLLKAQLGSGVDVSGLQQNISNVYAKGYGESLDEVQQALTIIKQMMPDLNGKELEEMTIRALAFSKATGTDVNESIKGARTLMGEFKISGEEAFDLLNKGAQKGLNANGDLADQLSEFAPIYKQAGYSADEMFGIMSNGWENGAFNLDRVNDLMNEFTTRLDDGTIADNMDLLSESTQNLFQEYKDGKVSAEDMFNAVIKDIGNMKNETDKAAAASVMFGSLGEDSSLKMVLSLAKVNKSYKDVEGTSDKVNKAVANNSPWEALKRNMKGSLTPFSDEMDGIKTKITDIINKMFDEFPEATEIGLGALMGGLALLAGAFIGALIPAGVFSAILDAIAIAVGVITSPITLAIIGIGLLAGAFVLAYKNIEPFRDMVDNALESVKNFATKVYNEYLKPAIDEVVKAFKDLAEAIKLWWDENGAQFMEALKNFFDMIWAFLQPALGFWSEIFKGTFETIVGLVKIGWDTIKGVFSGAFEVIKGLLDIFIGVFTGDWDKAWNGVKEIVSGVWKTITSGFEGFVDGITELASGIGDSIASGIGGAVNGVIDAINWVLDKLGAKKINHVSWGSGKKGKKGKRYAKGTDGHPGGHAIVNDGRGAELVVNPNGTAFIPQGKNVFIPNMAKGTRVFTAEQTASLFGREKPTFRYAKGIGNSILNFAGDILDFIKDPVGLLKDVAANFLDFGDLWQPWLGMAKGGVNYIMDSAKDYLTKLFKKKEESERVKYNPTAGVKQWEPIAKKALQMTGQYTAANLAALLYQMQTESGGNPNAINNWDINAKNGVPSQGLMQVIPPTFRAYAMPGYNKNILDPLSNILASIRYTLARYGSLTAGWRGVGYANGGFITKQHLAMVGEGNKPEVVIPLDKAKRSRAMQLLAKTKQIMGANDGVIIQNNVQTNDQSEVIALLTEQNSLLLSILRKDSNVYLDSKKVNKQLETARKETNMIYNKRLGLSN